MKKTVKQANKVLNSSSFIVERRPSWVDELCQKTERGLAYIELARSLGSIRADEHIAFDMPKFCGLFGLDIGLEKRNPADFAIALRKRLIYIRSRLRKLDIDKPRMASHEGKVYVWKIDV